VRRLSIIAGFLLLAGCRTETKSTSNPTASATASASASASAAPSAATSSDRKAFDGPTGTVKGVIRIVGDEPPSTPFDYPKGCEAASGVYGKLFRRGQEGQLADALVAVSGYDGYVPPSKEPVKITIKNCAYSTRTIALNRGQPIEIRNLDPLTSYLPHLDGAKAPSTNVAIPRGPAVKVYPSKGPLRFWLRDQMGKTFMLVHVWQLPYATHDVTGLDGRYEIEGVPVGKAKLSVMLPQTRTKGTYIEPLAENREIEVKEGENVYDVEMVFDADENTPLDGHGGTKPTDLKIPPKASASASASAAKSAPPKP
jgi:hypothetical protein